MTSAEPTSPPVIAAVIGAFVAVTFGIVNLFAAYRLKLKEFRVTQIKSRIDTLEQAGVSSGPESKENGNQEWKQNRTEEGRLLAAVDAMKEAAWYRLTETEKQYKKYKWLLNAESHDHIEKLLEECNELSSQLALASLDDVEAFKAKFPAFFEKTQEFQTTYENARLSTIERFYLILNKEVAF
jgi:hypothetical protein